jgi:hypothetical protein
VIFWAQMILLQDFFELAQMADWTADGPALRDAAQPAARYVSWEKKAN